MQSSLVSFLCIFFRYERFLKIMILSVLKNTHRPVKFWFIKNYLSPPFKVIYLFIYFFYGNSKQNLWVFLTYLNYFGCRRYSQDLIPHMAQEYGFEYELITYKWPTWLHKQKEKQRIIWAYKILFLDVIFPLSLEKVSCFFFYVLFSTLNFIVSHAPHVTLTRNEKEDIV